MHPASSVLRCFAVALLAGCASAPRTTPAGIGGPVVASVPTGDALEEAIASAKLRFNTAARTGDIAAMSAVFDADAIVITPARDTVRGRAAIAERIAQLAPAGGVVAQLLPRRIEACVDGATEFAGEWALWSLAAGPENARGGYAIRWSYDETAGMRVRTLVLHGTSPGETARGQREVRCVAPHVRAFAARRLELSVSPPRAGTWQSRAGESIADGMRGQGFSTRSSRTIEGGQSIQPGLEVEEAESSGAIAIRWQARPSLVVELFAPFSPIEAVVRGYNESESADVVLLHSGRVAGAIVSHDWRRLRVGAGPVFMRSTWTEREERLVTLRGGAGEFIGFDEFGFPDDERYTSNSVSALAEVGYTYPIAARVFMDARAHYRAFASHTTRGTTSLGPIDVDLGGFTAAIGFGLAF